MGNKLSRLFGKELISILSKIGFQPIRQMSHVILVKEALDGKKSSVVPLHKEIDKGTLLEIIKQVGLKRDDFMKLI